MNIVVNPTPKPKSESDKDISKSGKFPFINRSPNSSHTSRGSWGAKLSSILQEKHRRSPADYKADIQFIGEAGGNIDHKKFLTKLRKSCPKAISIFAIRDKKNGKPHLHCVIRGETNRSEFRRLLVDCLCQDKRRETERVQASAILDLRFQSINHDRAKALYEYTTKAGDRSQSIELFEANTQLTYNFNSFFESGEKEAIWKGLVASWYPKPEAKKPVFDFAKAAAECEAKLDEEDAKLDKPELEEAQPEKPVFPIHHDETQNPDESETLVKSSENHAWGWPTQTGKMHAMDIKHFIERFNLLGFIKEVLFHKRE